MASRYGHVRGRCAERQQYGPRTTRVSWRSAGGPASVLEGAETDAEKGLGLCERFAGIASHVFYTSVLVRLQRSCFSSGRALERKLDDPVRARLRILGKHMAVASVDEPPILRVVAGDRNH